MDERGRDGATARAQPRPARLLTRAGPATLCYSMAEREGTMSAISGSAMTRRSIARTWLETNDTFGMAIVFSRAPLPSR